MVILGIDPGSNRIGYGVLNKTNNKVGFLDCGCIELSPSTGHHKNLVILNQTIDELLGKWHPEVVAIEELFFFKNKKTVIRVSEARGIIIMTVAKRGIDIQEFTPLQVKRAVSSYGLAQKKEVQKMVRLILGLKNDPKPDDAADALAVAICCAHCVRI